MIIREKTWLRLYTSIVDDYDVKRLSDVDFRMLMMLWCIARMNGGLLPNSERIAFRLRLPEKQVEGSLERLTDAGYLDEKDGVLTPHNWSERQFESDTSTDRVRRFRERHSDVSRNVSCNVTETASETATDTDTDTEPPIAPHRGAKVNGSIRTNQRGWFDEFWATYPRKTAKQAAEKRFRVECKSQERFQEIMAGLHRQVATMLAKEPQFRPHPATWLSQGRWMDEPDAPQSETFFDGYEITGRPRCQ